MTRFSPLDYAVVAAYLIGVVILGLIYAKRQILSRQLKSPLVGRGDLDDRHPAQSDQLPGYPGN